MFPSFEEGVIDERKKETLLIIGCCSNQTTGDFLEYLDIYEKSRFKIPEPEKSLQKNQKRKQRNLFIEHDCIVSGLNENYVFFLRKSDNIPFCLSRTDLSQKITFDPGESLKAGDYIGEGKEGFLEENDISFESIPLSNSELALLIRPIGPGVLEDIKKNNNQKLSVILLTDSSEERWDRLAEGSRLGIHHILQRNGLQAEITEFNIKKSKSGKLEDCSVDIFIHTVDSVRNTIHGTMCKKEIDYLAQIKSLIGMAGAKHEY
jgi:hypothetical protein